MSLDDFALVLDRVGEHNGIVDLHGFGEPFLDAALTAKLQVLLQKWPLAKARLFSTLGVLRHEGFWDLLIEAGLRIIEVSFYGVDSASY